MLKINYIELAKAAQVIFLGGTSLKLSSKDTLYREIKRHSLGYY